jgi:tRNA threonylcarbamoyl adenosine modification protein (Sua5/YciO/YrdC/YwlC family)
MRLEIDARFPEPHKIARAAKLLDDGEVIAYPTDTVYGLGCDSFNKKAVERVYQIKGMRSDQPLALVCKDIGEIAKYAIVENQHYRILRRIMPGPYTIILEATREVPKMLLQKRKQIGVRVPDHPVVSALIEALGRPIISSTAGRPGQDAMIDPEEIDSEFHGLAMVLDIGACGSTPTTVIDMTGRELRVVREGAGPIDTLV